MPANKTTKKPAKKPARRIPKPKPPTEKPGPTKRPVIVAPPKGARLRRTPAPEPTPPRQGSLPRIYICHPFSGDVEGNIAKVRDIARRLAGRDQVLPIAPHLYLPQFVDETTNRELAMRMCLRLVEFCDEVWVYGTPSEGMQREIEHAKRLKIRVIDIGGVG